MRPNFQQLLPEIHKNPCYPHFFRVANLLSFTRVHRPAADASIHALPLPLLEAYYARVRVSSLRLVHRHTQRA
jgi:hypothetical protein